MFAPPTERPPIPTLPPGEVWTADRVRAQLFVDDLDDPLSRYRFEFIDGALLVTSSPEYAHQFALRDLFRILDPYVVAHGLGETLWSPSDVELAPNNLGQPDLFVVPPDEAARLRARRGPEPIRKLLLAVEALSPSTARSDQIRKRRHYVGHRVEYWIVDLDARTIARNAPGDARVDMHGEELVWHPAGATEPLVIDVVDYFRRVLGPDPDADDAISR